MARERYLPKSIWPPPVGITVLTEIRPSEDEIIAGLKLEAEKASNPKVRKILKEVIKIQRTI